MEILVPIQKENILEHDGQVHGNDIPTALHVMQIALPVRELMMWGNGFRTAFSKTPGSNPDRVTWFSE